MNAVHHINGFAIRMAGYSDPGRVRGNNEDYLDWDTTRGLALLADGVGGSSAGEVASRMAVSTLLELIPYPLVTTSVDECCETLRRAIEQANRRIFEGGRDAPFRGMSSTLVALWLCEGQAIFAHVGDSRIYRLRNGLLTQLTVDHSLVQEMVDSGVISRDEALHSTRRHIITRALGVRESVEVDIAVASLSPGDRYLLCSDGLSDMVDDTALAALLAMEDKPLPSRVDELIERANLCGGEDNIAALLVAVDDETELMLPTNQEERDA